MLTGYQDQRTEKERLDEAAVLLTDWYQKEKRDLPWRENKDPYRIWISEIMLQQTRVEAVKAYFTAFIEELPNIEALAMAEEERLMKLWEGLGYYSRAKNLQKAAKICVQEYQGSLPNTYEGLLKLPGIGSYTAGAVSSIAFGEKRPAVDGNVQRVVHRLTADYSDILSAKVKKQLEEKLTESLERTSLISGDCNQAWMELGACICIPNGRPLCEKCPLSDLCIAYKTNKISELPVKKKKAARKKEERTIFLVEDEKYLLLAKRKEKGLLAGMYELPAKNGFWTKEETEEFWSTLLEDKVSVQQDADSKHIFSHIEWQMRSWIIIPSQALESYRQKLESNGFEMVKKKQIKSHYAIPAAFAAWKSHWEVMP